MILKSKNKIKSKFHQHKEPISIKNIDINKIVVSNRVSFGKKAFKYFIGYKDAKKLELYIYFSQKLSGYRKDFHETKYMSFFIKDDQLLEKHNEICEKVKNSLKKEFNNEPVYNEKYLKAKINPITEKSTQISTTIKYQKMVLNIFAYQ